MAEALKDELDVDVVACPALEPGRAIVVNRSAYDPGGRGTVGR